MNVFVIGAGAAGLSAAISAARCGAFVTVLESLEKPAKKILVTGGGRCNYTNFNLDYDSYYSNSDDKLIKNFLYNFDSADAINFFESIGVYPLIRNGYVYPRSEEASSITQALLTECERLGVIIRNNTKVNSISYDKGVYIIGVENYSYKADRVIICSGGLAGTQSLSNEYGMYEVAKELGHNIVPPSPALTGIETNVFESAAGIRTRARVSIDNYSEIGEIQISKIGLSGIPIMNLSRNINLNDCIHIDFIPEISESELQLIKDSGNELNSLLPKKLSLILNFENVKNYKINNMKLRGYKSAQVTKGGVDKKDIDPNTFESLICPGLFFAGEIIDVDGRCGGYNLHFAWGSGIIAGTSAAGSQYKHIMPSISQLRRWENAEIGNRRTDESDE